MVELSNSAPITLAPGEVATFNTVILDTGNCTCHRANTGSIKMNYRGFYDLRFSGNITGATAGTPVQIAMTLGGTPLPETTMISTPTAAGDLNNVATSTYIHNCCNDFSRVSIQNTGTVPVTIGVNANFSVRKAF